MLWGVAVGLIDEREWGTLLRLRVSGASLPGMMIGKLTSRFLLGLVQMIALLAVGAALFGVYLGRNPLMLLVPAAAISFAAAAFSLVIAGIAPSRDAVLPIGVMMAMAMSAIGGCWWPLDFEPRWIRAAAWWMPTTWTMRAFNDLMIRELAPSSALRPAAITIALGLVYLAIGLLTAPKLYQQRSR
jgi:ABC-2 type transport system permease protein